MDSSVSSSFSSNVAVPVFVEAFDGTSVAPDIGATKIVPAWAEVTKKMSIAQKGAMRKI